VRTPSPYIVLRGKQHELIKLFKLQSLISLTINKFRIHNPCREISGFTIQYRANNNDTTVEDMTTSTIWNQPIQHYQRRDD
jgi:hypothetical protein